MMTLQFQRLSNRNRQEVNLGGRLLRRNLTKETANLARQNPQLDYSPAYPTQAQFEYGCCKKNVNRSK